MTKRTGKWVMSIDPGKTCGWVRGKGRHVSSFGHKNWEEFLLWFDALLTQEILIDRVVIERFHNRVLTEDSELTIEVIGAIKYICSKHDVPYGMVNPSDKIKTIGRVQPSIQNRHARDAEAIRLWDLRYGHWK